MGPPVSKLRSDRSRANFGRRLAKAPVLLLIRRMSLTFGSAIGRCWPLVVVAAFWVSGLGIKGHGAAADWPQFRGPRGNSVSDAANPPLHWSGTSNVTWKVAVPGRGRSSPVVAKKRIWLTTALEKNVQRKRIGPDDMQTAEHVSLGVVCLEAADGRLLWHVTLYEVENPDPVHWLNSWATPTPVARDGRLYCDFGTFGTCCLDGETGKVVWKQRLPLDHQVGPGSSPVLYEDRLILVRDGRDAQYVAALDVKTGEQIWKTDRPPLKASSNNLKKSFSTPIIVEHAGKTQMMVPGSQWMVSYDPRTGKEHWRARHGSGFSIGACPVFGHGKVYFSTGCPTAQLYAIRTDGEGDVTDTHVAWKVLRQIPVMSSPVLVGEEVYWVSDSGMATCANPANGEAHWQERLGGSHLASPLYAAGRIYFFDKDGKTTAVKAGPRFERLAENAVEGALTATPALVDGTLFLRTDTHLYCIQEK